MFSGRVESPQKRIRKARRKELGWVARVLDRLKEELVKLVLTKTQTNNNFDNFCEVYVDYQASKLVIDKTKRSLPLINQITKGLHCHPNFLHFRLIVIERDLTAPWPKPLRERIPVPPGPDHQEPQRPSRPDTPSPAMEEARR